MSRLPPVEKLPLAARKDIRDSWESAKDGLAQDLSSLLGQTWTIDVNPNQLYAYAKEGYAKEQPGAMIAQYIGAALDRLRSFVDRHGDAGKKEINDVCTAHALTIDVNTEHDFLYNGCAVTPEGQLAILFNEDKLAVNIDDPLEEDKLAKALNSAPTAGAAMSYVARSSIENGWEKDAEETKKKFFDILQTEVALDPQFQQTHDALKASSEIELDRWEGNIGDFTRFYFEALANGLKSQNFESDEMMREALVEALEKGKIAFRIVDKSQMKALYNECVFEGGVLYMQTTAERFGANIDNVADGLVDLL